MRSVQLLRSMKRTFLPCFLSVIVIAITSISTEFEYVHAVRAPPAVEINKCCRIGEKLERNRQCTVGGTSDQWWPTIYLIQKQAYFPKQGEAPRFMRVHEFKQPGCENPELFMSGIALFSNGSLFLGERGSFFDTSDYCIDKDIALVCLPGSKSADSLRTPIKLTKIRKCCSLKSVYSTQAQTCVPYSENDDNDAIPQKLFQTKNTSQIDLVYGFPSCSPATNNKFVIAAQFNEHHLNDFDGTYVLENTKKVLTNDEFCIEHTNQNSNTFTGTVFACDELVSVKESPSELKNQEVCFIWKYFFYGYVSTNWTCFFTEPTVSLLFNRLNYFCNIFVIDIGDWFSTALKSSCAALQMSDLLRRMFVDWRFTSCLNPIIGIIHHGRSLSTLR